MTSIILYGGVRIPAEEGPSHSKIFPPDQADRIVKAFRERSEGGWLEYQRDPEKAVAVWRRDERIDAMYNSLFRELLTYMMEDPRNIGLCTHLHRPMLRGSSIM